MNSSPRRASGSDGLATAWLVLALTVMAYLCAWLLISDEGIQWCLFHAVVLSLVGAYVVRQTLAEVPDPMHPMLLLMVLMYLYATGSAINVRREGCTQYGTPVSPELLAEFYCCCVLAVASLVAGAWCHRTSRDGTTDDSSAGPPWAMENKDCVPALFISGVLLAIPFASTVLARFNPFQVDAYADWCFESRVLANDNPLQVVLQVAGTTPAMLLFGAAVVVMVKHRYTPFKIGAGLAALAYTLVPLSGGDRGEVINAVIMIAAFCHYRLKRLSVSFLAVAVVLGYVFVTSMSIARQTNDPVEMAKIVVSEIHEGDSRFLQLGDSTELWTAQNLMELIWFIDQGETSFNYGAYVWTELLVFIPRAVFPNRPLNLQHQFTEVLSPGDTALGKGYGFFIVQEGYWMYGKPGVVLSMFLLGWTLERLFSWFTARMRYDVVALCYGVVLGVVAGTVRRGIMIQVKSALMLVAPIILVGYLTSRRSPACPLCKPSQWLWNSRKASATYAVFQKTMSTPRSVPTPSGPSTKG